MRGTRRVQLGTAASDLKGLGARLSCDWCRLGVALCAPGAGAGLAAAVWC
jgi:hypothetical protein